MNEIALCEALRTRLSEIVPLMQMPTDAKDETLKAPRIVNGYLEPKRSRGPKEEEPDFPYVIVRPPKGSTDPQGMTTVNVNILIGCYSEEFDGYEYCLHVLSEIRRGLMERPNLTPHKLGSVFRMEYPFDWDMPDDQPWPEFIIMAKTRWTIATPQQISDDEV